MKTFYEVHIEVERNIGNTNYTRIFKTMEEAKKYRNEINNYHGNENVWKRDSYAKKITRHTFKDSVDMFNNEKFSKLEEQYFNENGCFAY